MRSQISSLLITKYIKNAEDMLNMSTENIEKLRDQSGQISLDEINSGIVTLSGAVAAPTGAGCAICGCPCGLTLACCT